VTSVGQAEEAGTFKTIVALSTNLKKSQVLLGFGHVKVLSNA